MKSSLESRPAAKARRREAAEGAGVPTSPIVPHVLQPLAMPAMFSAVPDALVSACKIPTHYMAVRMQDGTKLRSVIAWELRETNLEMHPTWLWVNAWELGWN